MFLFKVALQYAFIAFFIGGLWVVMTNQPNPFGFGLGFVIGFLLLVTLRGKHGLNVRLTRLPQQLGWALLYLLVLTRDIVISGWDVSLRILGLRPIKSGIIKVPIGDKRPEIGALTAHGITITPGQLVVEFDHQEHVYVHCLDVDSAAQTIEAEQARRLKFYRGMMGDDVA